MAGGKLRGVPSEAAQALGARRFMRRGWSPIVVGNDQSLVSIQPRLMGYLKAQSSLPKFRGRPADWKGLLQAARALDMAKVPLTTGTNCIGPRVVAQAMWPKSWQSKLYASREICRRLKKIVDRVEGGI